ncbi:eye-specific diacylglycerol kinase isoform X2 [Anopheles stephensi]|uniref:eye-specific diacylglycerol kinase isoform X2 n=1 Tax=Anopheles stephensi TaxID=30069 RepID=UPI0016587FBF|nr:eye-specific diacylglycerol kinase isoform X2 [Anopheles stephensi]
MHRLRNTFTRSRTPTGAEMKTQSSLEVPKQVRSASFDEIQLEAQRSHQQRSLSAAAAPSVDEASGVSSGVGSLLLQVPQTTPGQRSRSFDLAGSASDEGSAVAAAFLDVPKRFQRRKSSSKTPPPCIHCLYLEEYRRLIGVEQRLYYDSEEYQAYVDYTSSSCSEEDDDDDEEEDEHENAEGASKKEDEAVPGVSGVRVGQVEGTGSVNRVAADRLAGPSGSGVAVAGGSEASRGNFSEGYYDDDYDYDDDDDDDEDDYGYEAEDNNEGNNSENESERSRRGQEQKKEPITFGLETPAYDYATLFQRVSPRRRPRVDGEGADGSVALLSPPPVASPCRITLTLSPTKPDDEDDEQCIDYSHGTSGSTLEATGLGEIALMLPDEELPVGAGVILEPEPRPPTVSASAATECQPSEASGDTVDPVPSRTRRRSISRQEAIIVEPTGSSLENVSNASDSRPVPDILTGADDQDNQPPQPRPPQRGRAASMGPIIPTSSPPPLPPYTATVRLPRQQLESVGIPLESPPPSATISIAPSQPGDFVRDIYLQVPDLKRDRAASVDSCFTKVTGAKTEELQPPPDGACLNLLAVPSSGAVRSRSVDIVLPTEQQARYKALALAGPSGSANSAGPSGAGVATGGHLAPSVRGLSSHTLSHLLRVLYCRWLGDPHGRQIRCTPDWSENAVSGDHLWVPTSVSGDCCYVGDNDCTKHGPRMKCAACKIISHASCISVLMERSQLQCKPTFRDVGVRQYREQTKTTHHWVHRRTEKGKCKQCGKSLQAKLTFSSKEIVALSCAWCKASYHNKEACFNPERIGEECTLGAHRSIVVPPSWIVKLPRKGNFKSSLRKTPQKKKKAGKKVSIPREPRTFVIKPIPTANITPVLVFINPKSGGNQGAKLLQKFQWLLNPRQVFDLTQGGPRMGLELFRKVPQLRILACGGDGTVGWVLSVLDQINFVPPPAVGVLPLGTGNDLARALGWGGGYTDEPIGKILANIGNSDTVLLDRWSLKVEPNTSVPNTGDGKDNLPLNVVNNYFSLGVDAHIALEFHEAREAHPEKFNSRLRNKMFYGQAGGKDLLKRKWKGLAEFVTLECDGKDLTPKLKEHKVHAIVFLNIPSYGGGTHPWNKSGGQFEPATDDGMIEVVGLTTYQLPLLQAGGHGTCITQCRTARIVTSRTIPMQVDGEACKLNPSNIELTLLNKAVMLAKKKPGRANVPQEKLEALNISLMKIMMADYEQHHYDKELLRQSAVNLGMMEVPVTDLEQMRVLINKFCSEQPDSPKLSPDWCFIDSCTAERFFRVDRAQENLHFITDIATDCVFVLDQESPTLPQTPEDDHRRLGAQGATVTGSLESSDSGAAQFSPQAGKLLDRSLSGPPASGDIPSAYMGTQGSNEADRVHVRTPIPQDLSIDQSLDQLVNFKSFHERLFGLNEDAFGFSNLLEKTTDAVIKAAKMGDVVMLKDLHLQGYSLLSIDCNGQTALHHGARCGHKEIVRYLISFAPNAIINMIDNETGQTALHKAAAARQRTICYMLVAGGALLSIQDNEGRTARFLASQTDDYELAFYLETQEQFQLMDLRSNNI